MTMIKTAKKTPKRTISQELFKQWQRFTRQGDIRALMELTGRSKPTITNALQYGAVVNSETIATITDYFINRETTEQEQAEKLKAV